MIVDELHGTLIAYEMRTEQEDPSGQEAAFKASNQKGTSKQNPKLEYSYNDESDSEAEAKFVRKLIKGACKYKGKLPLICFECGRIGHFASKCPYAKNTILMMKITTRKTRVLKIIKETMEGLPKAKISIQRRTIAHLMMTLIVIMTWKRCSSWP